MNYEFHVGDYVEAAGGAKGYICDANKDWWYCTNADDEYSFGYVYRIVRLGSGEIHECYNRIGAYDFTKKEKKKIEALTINKTMYQYTGDGTSNGGADYTAVYDNTKFQDKMIDKINELVDAVNKLMDKEDKNDQTAM